MFTPITRRPLKIFTIFLQLLNFYLLSFTARVLVWLISPIATIVIKLRFLNPTVSTLDTILVCWCCLSATVYFVIIVAMLVFDPTVCNIEFHFELYMYFDITIKYHGMISVFIVKACRGKSITSRVCIRFVKGRQKYFNYLTFLHIYFRIYFMVLSTYFSLQKLVDFVLRK